MKRAFNFLLAVVFSVIIFTAKNFLILFPVGCAVLGYSIGGTEGMGDAFVGGIWVSVALSIIFRVVSMLFGYQALTSPKEKNAMHGNSIMDEELEYRSRVMSYVDAGKFSGVGYSELTPTTAVNQDI